MTDQKPSGSTVSDGGSAAVPDGGSAAVPDGGSAAVPDGGSASSTLLDGSKRGLDDPIRAVCALVLAGAGLGLFAVQLALLFFWPEVYEQLLTANELPRLWRRVMLATTASGAAIALAVAIQQGNADWSSRATVWSRRLLPGLPLAFLPPLLSVHWFFQPIAYLPLLGAWALAFEQTLRVALPAWAESSVVRRLPLRRLMVSPRLGFWIAVSLSVAYAVVTGYLTVLKHWRFGTGAFDLAIFDNMMANFLDGNFYRSTVMFGNDPGNALANHAHFSALLFVPFYAIWPSSETLLILQALLVGGAGIPLYLFGRARSLSPAVALSVVVAYLLFSPLQAGQFYDFHFLTLIPFWLFWLFWAMATGRRWLLIGNAVVLFGMREDVALGVAIVGGVAAMSSAMSSGVASSAAMSSGATRSNLRKTGIALAVAGVLWTILAKGVIMPAAGSWWFSAMYKELIAPGEQGFGAILRTLLSNPGYSLSTLLREEKLVYLLHLLVPVVFLVLRRPVFALLAAPGFFFTFLTTGWHPAVNIGYQYTAHWAPYLFGAVVLALVWLKERGGLSWQWAAALALLAASSCHNIVYGVVLKPTSFANTMVEETHYSLTEDERERLEAFRELSAMIPDEASVAATDIEAPHLSNRPDLYAIAQHAAPGRYLLVDKRSLHLARTRENLKWLLRDHPYGLIAQRGSNLFLFELGHKSKKTRRAARRLGVRLPRPESAGRSKRQKTPKP